MLSENDNRLITETGPGSTMGSLMRQYWMPVIRADQLEAGAPPTRLTIMGQKLVAFRSPRGEVGLMDEACPHRGASLALARNEECGLRCVYHGWKIAPAGKLLEAPTHPAGTRLSKIPTRAHPVHVGQGMVWTWLGEGQAPPLPELAFTNLPDDHVLATTAVLNCNWLHPFETLWDVFHAQILHNQTNRSGPRADVYFSEGGHKAGELTFDYPEMKVKRTDFGFTYINLDAAKETTFHFIVPNIQFHATSPGLESDKAVQISVPIDDDHCLLWLIFFNRFAPLGPDGLGLKGLGHITDRNNFLKGFDDRRPENRWGQDRAAMARGESYSGVPPLRGIAEILAEDVLVIESQGRANRSIENLAPTDRALVEGRRTLVDAARAHQRGDMPMWIGRDLSDVESQFLKRERPQEPLGPND